MPLFSRVPTCFLYVLGVLYLLGSLPLPQSQYVLALGGCLGVLHRNALRDALLEGYPPPFPTHHGDARLAELEMSSREGY